MIDEKSPSPDGGVGKSEAVLREIAHAPEMDFDIGDGATLGPYTILQRLGGGGMGEVYRARDARLGRDVAIKVVRSGAGAASELVRRFEHEARAAGALNHANVLTVYDVGFHAGMPFIVFELLEGETLRQRIEPGALSPGAALDIGLQIARGLSAAHAHRIIHRDLKPENVFITRDGVVKILDFGLAKLEPREGAGDADMVIGSTLTKSGIVLGTLGYMSPEQVRGLPADARSDIFSFGAVLYEMLTGRRAFDGASAADAMAAILREEPAFPAEPSSATAAGLFRIAARCLAKEPDTRIQAARDLAFALEDARGAPRPSARRRRGLLAALGVIAVAASAVAGSRFSSAPHASDRGEPQPSIRRVTFRHGQVVSARFATDGQTVVYAATWGGQPLDVFSTREGSPESSCLDLAGADLLAVSSTGELALKLVARARDHTDVWGSGTLARRSLAGGGPRELLEDVKEADWTPDGTSLAVVREVDGAFTLELPAGTVLYRSEGWLSHARVSPAGDRVAFLEHPHGADGGSVRVVDLGGRWHELATGFATVQGLAWTPSGREVWFTGSRSGGLRALSGVDLDGRERLIYRVPAVLTLHDIARDGRVLVTQMVPRFGLMVLAPGKTREQDMSWFDGSDAADLSSDGTRLLISENREAGQATYVRGTDWTPAVRLGEGIAWELSPDQAWALAIAPRTPRQLVMLPVGAGQSRTVTHDSIDHVSGHWFADGKNVLFAGIEPGGGGPRLYVQEVAGGAPRAITPTGVWREPAIAPDGGRVAVIGNDGRVWLYPVSGAGGPVLLEGAVAGDLPARFSSDGRSLYVFRRGEWPARVHRIELATGKRVLWRELLPPDATSSNGVMGKLRITPDGQAYAYAYDRSVADLFVLSGID